MARIHDFYELAEIETDECVEWPFGTSKQGYGQVWFESRVQNCHRLVLVLREGDRPSSIKAAHGPCVSRRCMNYRHLSWKTDGENAADRKRDGTENIGERNGMAKLTAEMVVGLRERVGRGETQRSVATSLGIDQSTVSDIVRGKYWGWLS